MTRPNYGAVGAAITGGMSLIHASERADSRTHPAVYGTVAYGPPTRTWATFETTREATAGDGEARPLCEGLEPDLFFPEARRRGDTELLAMIQRICLRCPRRAPCREDGAGEPHGVWGGQRSARRKRGAA